MKTKIIYFLSIVLIFGITALTSCNCDDVNSADSDWVGPLSPTLIVKVLIPENTPLGNAVVTVTAGGETYTGTTNADGTYTFNNLKAGTYTIVASYPSDESYVSKTRTVTIVNGKATEKDILLSKANDDYTKDGSQYKIHLPDIVTGQKSEETTLVTYTLPAEALEEGDELKLKSWYDFLPSSDTRAFASGTRGSNDTIWTYTGYDAVISVNAEAVSGATTTNTPICIAVHELIHPYKVVHNNKEVSFTLASDSAYITTNELGQTDFYYKIYKSNEIASTEPITFAQSTFEGPKDNISTTYIKKSGSVVTFPKILLSQFVKEIEANTPTEVETETVSLNKSYYIPTGEAIILTGTQSVATYTYKCETQRVTVKKYGDVTYKATDREHTGGSSVIQ